MGNMETVQAIKSIASRHRRFWVESIWVVGGQLGVALALIVGNRFITEYVSPAIFGEISLHMGIVYLLRNLILSPILQGMARLFIDAVPLQQEHLVRAAARKMLTWGIAGVVFLLLAGGGLYGGISLKSNLGVFVLLSTIMVVDAARSLEGELLTISRRQRVQAIWRVAEAFARPCAIVGLVVWLGATPASYLLGQFLSVALIFVVFRLSIDRVATQYQESVGMVRNWQGEIIRFALPLAPLVFIGWITNLSDRYIIAGFQGEDSVGIYAATYGLASQPFAMLNGILGTMFNPIQFDAVTKGDREKEQRVMGYRVLLTLLVSLLVWILIWAIKDWLGGLLLAREYRSGISLMPWIAGGYALGCLGQAFTSRCYAVKRTDLVLAIEGIGALVCLVLELFLIWKWGLPGAAMAVPCYMGTQVLMAYLFSCCALRQFHSQANSDMVS